MKSLRRAPLVLAVVLVGMPGRADAHLLNTGLGPFYDGLAHLFVTPMDLLPVVAMALLAGLRGPRFGRAALFALPAGWIAGSLCGALVGAPLTLPRVTAAATVALGGLVAADRPLSLPAVTALAIGIAVFSGMRNGVELASAPSGGLVAAGIACAIFAVVSLASGQAAAVRAVWSRTALRVAGSWIAASGLFMFGWAMRGG